MVSGTDKKQTHTTRTHGEYIVKDEEINCEPTATVRKPPVRSHSPIEVLYRYRDSQLQLGENYSYLFNLSPNICKSWYLNTQWFERLIKQWFLALEASRVFISSRSWIYSYFFFYYFTDNEENSQDGKLPVDGRRAETDVKQPARREKSESECESVSQSVSQSVLVAPVNIRYYQGVDIILFIWHGRRMSRDFLLS